MFEIGLTVVIKLLIRFLYVYFSLEGKKFYISQTENNRKKTEDKFKEY
jgi:hypothetical protein